MIDLEFLPYGQQAIYDYYGDPKDKDFRLKHLKTAKLPFLLVLSWQTDRAITSVTLHEKVIDSFIDALEDIKEQVGESKLHELGWDRWGGGYIVRPKTGSRDLSTHSWGIAVDLNPHLGPYGKPSDGYPKVFRVAFQARGWVWGGRWQTPDGMHFQAARGY